MRSDEIDFTPIDPKADPQHWESLLLGVTERLPERLGRPSLPVQIIRWRVPAMAAAAAVAVLIWGAALFTGATTNAPLSQTRDPSYALLSWATSNEPPQASTIMMTLGGHHE